MDTALLEIPACELASMVRSRVIGPVELVKTHIQHIQRINPAINALVADRFEEALAEALKLEKKLASRTGRNDLPPLAGVPCTVKDFIAVRSMPQTAGLIARKHVLATDDATVTRRIRRAGAIILGTTNVPEGGLWMESANPVYGRTRNPWDLSRTSGGSSGGEAALVAAGGSAFGIGSDIGGSIRIPSGFCGVFGHKPTGGLVPSTGHWMRPEGPAGAFLTCGPITRSARDLMPLVQAMAGPDGKDPVARTFDLGRPEAVDFRQVTVYPVPASGRGTVWPEMKKAVHRAAEALKARGARIAELNNPRLQYALGIWGAMMTEHPGPSFAEVLGDGKKVSLFSEILRWPFGRGRHTVAALGVIVLEGVLRHLTRVHGHLAETGRKLKAELEEQLGPHGVILHPPYSRVAPYHFEPLLTPFDFAFSGIFNVLAFPATAIPAGFDHRGMPVSVQAAARCGADHLTIAVAEALEKDLGGYRRAKLD